VLKYDDVLNRQREAIYSDRRRILEGDDLHERAQQFLEDVVGEVVSVHTAEGHADDWDLDALWTELRTLFPISITPDEVITEAGTRGKVSHDFLLREILSDAKLQYQKREDSLGSAAMRELERRVVLSVIDRRWRDHLYEMDYLKDGIGLRAMAQRDPLVEYQREGFALFQTMMGQIREEAVGFLFNLDVEVTPAGATATAPVVAAKGLGAAAPPAQGLKYSAPSADNGGEVEVRNERGQVDQASTARERAQQATAVAPPRGTAPAAQAPAQRGAFGQAQEGAAAPVNRAQRRAQGKKK